MGFNHNLVVEFHIPAQSGYCGAIFFLGKLDCPLNRLKINIHAGDDVFEYHLENFVWMLLGTGSMHQHLEGIHLLAFFLQDRNDVHGSATCNTDGHQFDRA